MNSFYGGINGAPFKISQIFKSVTYDNEIEATRETSMLNDLEKRWQSNIGIDEYVLVSYGLPTDKDSYDKYLNIDKANNEKNYNGTLWQKIYEENDSTDVNNIGSINGEQYENIIFVNGSNKGFGYKLIASFAGQTPYFSIRHVQGEANEEHYVKLDFENNEIDRPILTFYEPQAWEFEKAEDVILTADQKPRVEFEAIDKDGEITTGNHSKKRFTFSLPEPWNITTTTEVLNDPTADPYVKTTTSNNEKGTKIFEFGLPKARSIEILDPYLDNETNQSPIGVIPFEEYWINNQSVLQARYQELTPFQMVPLTYTNETTNEITSCLLHKSENGNLNYTIIKGVRLANSRIEVPEKDEVAKEKAQNTTYSALFINNVLDALEAIRTTWCVYHDPDIETAVMLNVAHEFDEATGAIIINGKATAMTAQLDDNGTLEIKYPSIGNQ